MQWNQLTYHRRMELHLWSILDKHQVMIEPGKRYEGEERGRLRLAILEFQSLYTWADYQVISDIIGLAPSSLSSTVNH